MEKYETCFDHKFNIGNKVKFPYQNELVEGKIKEIKYTKSGSNSKPIQKEEITYVLSTTRRSGGSFSEESRKADNLILIEE